MTYKAQWEIYAAAVLFRAAPIIVQHALIVQNVTDSITLAEKSDDGNTLYS